MSNQQIQTSEIRRATALLNHCIEVCIDGQKFFAEAAANVRNPTLKEMFERYSHQHAAFVLALQSQMTKAGMAPENEGTVAGAARRELMEMVHALEPAHRDIPIVRKCVSELEAERHIYVYATAGRAAEMLPVDLRVTLEEQHAAVRAALTETLARLDSQ